MEYMIQEKLYKRKQELLALRKEIKNKMVQVPEEMLRTNICHGKLQCYIKSEPREPWKYLKKKDENLAKQIAMRDYNSSLLKELDKQLEEIERFLKYYDPEELEKIYKRMSPGRKMLVHPWIEPDEQYVERWSSQEYQGKEMREDSQKIYTEKGERVRSKSEKIIADKLFQKGIPYRYEYPIFLKGMGKVYPDFICLHVKKRRQIVWEHFGMMGDAEYCKKALGKISAYTENAYQQGRDIIFTFESSEHSLNTKEIDLMIEQKFK